MSFTPKLFTELKHYSREKAIADVFAGITVGVVALPLAMAFAIASGLPPERGIFTAIIAGFIISAIGGSKVQIGGPTGAFVILVSGIMVKYGYNGLAVCTLMSGIMLVLFGLFRFGALIKFIPFPVTTGFTTGIAVVILSTQIKDFFGLKIETVPAEFIEKWHMYLSHLSTLSLQSTLVGVGTVIIIIFLRKFYPKLPAMLIGMLVATIIASILKLNVETIGSRFGDLPRVLPAPSLPDFTFVQMKGLIQPAFTIALLAAIESLLSATVADGMIGGKHRPNIELIGQGIANFFSVMFGGIPATGAIARTATNVKSGGKTPVAGIIHAIVLALLLLLFAPMAKLIPLSALSGILVVVSYNMSELHHFSSILKGPRSDAFVLVLTFILTVLVDLTVAVQVGVILSAMLFIKRMAEISNVGMITKMLRGDEDEKEDPNALKLRQVPEGVEVFEVIGPFFFGMIDTFKNTIRQVEKPPKALIIRIRNVISVDASALHVLRELNTQCKKDNTLLIFSGVHSQPLIAFERAGFLDEVGRDNFLGNIDDALNRAREIMGLALLERNSPFTPTVEREKI
ncbi:MAG: sulfate permease [Candidatus Cloacimonetes bacterium]|nr:sulfate permease [Candidatus Cloacimonadota bacterium]